MPADRDVPRGARGLALPGELGASLEALVGSGALDAAAALLEAAAAPR